MTEYQRSPCNNCSGGLHHMCGGNCFCGCEPSNNTINFINIVLELQENRKKINDIAINRDRKIIEIDWEAPNCKSKMHLLIRELEHALHQIKELSDV